MDFTRTHNTLHVKEQMLVQLALTNCSRFQFIPQVFHHKIWGIWGRSHANGRGYIMMVTLDSRICGANEKERVI